jgi:hypothetical protein
MSQLVKTKRQAVKLIKKKISDLEPLRGEQKNVFNSFVCKLGFFWHEFHSRFKGPLMPKKPNLHTTIFYFGVTMSIL